MYVTGPRYEYKLFYQSRAKLWGWINLNNLTVLHSYHLKVIRDTPSRGLSIKLSPRSTNTKNNSLRGWHKKRKGRGRGRGRGEKSETPVPFSLPPNLLPLSRTATQATSTLEPLYNEGPRDWSNMFAVTRFRFIELLFQYFTITGARNIVRYTKVFVL